MKNILKKSIIIALAIILLFGIIGCDDSDITGVESPSELVAQMTIGWNLGNTLDAHHFEWRFANPPRTVDEMERAWVPHRTNNANIDAIKNAGFNTIRIPVSWYKACDAAFNIRADWMARVKEIVDYAVANDLFIILNTHHDEEIFKFDNAGVGASLIAFRKIWEQIADTFKDYDEKLIFEGLNEPRTKGSANEWNGGTAAERANLNKYYEAFVEVVRNSGGKNDNRYLLIATYGASPTQAAINGLRLPEDNAKNRLIVSIHSYEPYNFALNRNSAFNTWSRSKSSDTKPITDMIDRIYNAYIKKGIPVIIGEFGAMNKNNEPARAQWSEFYVKYAMDRGIPCVWWDNGATTGTGELFGLLNRSNNTFHYPLIIEALMNGVK